MIRRRGYGFYKPPQYVTGRIDDFPLVPETPIDIVPRPILAPAPAAAPAELVATAPPAEPARKLCGGPPASKAVIEVLEAAKELAVTAPSVANEVLRILESEELPPAETTAIIEVAAPKAKSGPRKKSPPKKKKAPPPPVRLSRLELHQSHCQICGYEDQDEIDEAFVSWENVSRIAKDYEIDRRGIYRHAHATGLFAKRDRNIRRALGRIIHEADHVIPTADSVVRAIKTLTHINAHGDWVQPPTHVVFSSATAHPAAKRSDTPCKVKKGLKR